ncbi:MAG: hypothetical protein AAFU85_03820 [Planctomycetota bacterium]
MAEESPNPYEATEATADEQRPPVETSSINYPGGLKSVALIGVVCGAITGICFSSIVGLGEGVAAIPLLLWCGSFIGLALVLPGSIARRVLRAIFAFLLSIAGAILYVPVCGFSMVVQDGFSVYGPQATVSWIFSSVVAFTSVLFVGALIIRRSARLWHYVLPNRSMSQQPIEETTPTGFTLPDHTGGLRPADPTGSDRQGDDGE